MTGLVASTLVVLRVVEEPADVRVVDAADHRAVRIAVAVGELVMVDVMAGPPERPLLHRGGADERPDEARDAVHLERAVREVAVEDQRQADGAHEMRGGPQRDERPAERHGEDQQRRRLHQPENGDLYEIWQHGLNLSQRAGDGNAGRANRREQAAGRTHQRGKDQTAGEQRRRDAELERDFAEAREVRRAGRQAVHRQRQQAADRRRRRARARSTRRETRSRCATARSRARAACRSRASGRRPPRTSCSSRRTSRRSTGSA